MRCAAHVALAPRRSAPPLAAHAAPDTVCRREQEFAAFTEEIEDTLEALDKLEDAEIKEMVETRDKDERMETQDMLSKVLLLAQRALLHAPHPVPATMCPRINP
jgi:hypothetical protein